MILGIPREIYPKERRVAMVPAVIPNLKKAGLEVLVEAGAGHAAGYPDKEYVEKGAKLAADRAEVFRTADIIVQFLCHGANDQNGNVDLPLFRKGQVLMGFLRPLGTMKTLQEIAERGVTSFAVELMPRITRAQSMDVLSSMATICGYKAVLLAADTLPRMCPMLTTAAGTIAPARVLIIGAGVAGLQAIATARRLGAVVEAFDTRPVVKEQVQSLGAKFLEVDLGETGEGTGGYAKELSEEAHRKEVELLAKAVKDNDIVITTAAIPGRPAQKLITADMVRSMKPGSVIVDLAAETGGNTELTKPGEIIDVDGVRIDGTTNIPSTMPYHASQMYSRNIQSLLGLMITKEGKLNLDMNDDVIKGTVITKDGDVVHEQTKKILEPQKVPA